jgi:hypothetical protein
LALDVGEWLASHPSHFSPRERDNQNIKIVNKYLGNVVKLNYLGMTETKQNCIHEKIRANKIWRMLAMIHFRVFCLHQILVEVRYVYNILVRNP